MLLKGKKRSNKGLLLLVQAWWVGKFEQRVGKIIFNGDSKKEKKNLLFYFSFGFSSNFPFGSKAETFPGEKSSPSSPSIHSIHSRETVQRE